MRIFKVRWWIPVAVATTFGALFVAMLWQRDPLDERSAGLGVAEGPQFDLRSMWDSGSFANRVIDGAFSRFLPPPAAMSLAIEEYATVSESGFRETTKEHLSTVSIDVDTASFSNVRRLLNEGSLPPDGAVRVEEMLNYFSYAYAEPEGGDPVSITTEVGPCPWTPSNRLLRIGLKSKPVEPSKLPPVHLTFLLDVSGSMNHPAKLPLVKQSLGFLIDQLRPQDYVSIVVYAGAAGLVLPPTPGSQHALIRDAIERLDAGGSTAGGEGIRLAYKTARSVFRQDAINRVILATDGDFNVGVRSDAELQQLVEEEREHGVFLTVLGFGMGNLKDSKLETLADHGNGQYAYIDSALEARRMFVDQIGATLATVAKDVKFQVEFNAARVREYRLIGYENRILAPEDFVDDRKDAGDMGAGHTVTALYELVPNGVTPLPEDWFTVRIRYKEPRGLQSREITHAGTAEIGVASEDLQFAAAVTQFAMLLTQSAHRGSATYASTMELARASANDERRALVDMIERAEQLDKKTQRGAP